MGTALALEAVINCQIQVVLCTRARAREEEVQEQEQGKGGLIFCLLSKTKYIKHSLMLPLSLLTLFEVKLHGEMQHERKASGKTSGHSLSKSKHCICRSRSLPTARCGVSESLG